MLSGDIETNPGPKKDYINNLAICHWNLNSLWVENFEKLALITAFISLHKFDIFCVAETFLDSSVSDDDPRLALDGYSLIRSDHPADTKRGGVCIFYKSCLSLVHKPELSNLNECIVCEIHSGIKRVFLTLIYRSPSQTLDEFNLFKQKLDMTLSSINNYSPYLSLLLGDLNARNTTWWEDDITNTYGTDMYDLASLNGLHQLIDEPTHILPNSSSCIDLIFSSTTSSIIESGVLPSLHPRCHHQLTFVKINFKVVYPLPYKRRIWDFPKADCESIKRAMDSIDWDNILSPLCVNKRVEFLTETILNVCSNFIPNKIVVVRDKDTPWMSDRIKKLILEKAKAYRQYVKHGKAAADLSILKIHQSKCKAVIKTAKDDYYNKLAASLNEPNVSAKKYWSTINRILNKKKIPLIPPLHDNNRIVTDTMEKANIFNKFFAKQCSLLETTSELPQSYLLTNHHLNSVKFDSDKILKIIRSLNVNKAHGWDNLSVRMIKICDDTLIKPLVNIFKCSLATSVYPSYWKRGNISPCHKKKEKFIVNNYRPVSLLPILDKVFEKCIYDDIYTYFEKHSLFSSCQSGFRRNDSCISQLLSITHDIFSNFDANPAMDTRGVFLDISKAFDRVWHEGLIFKLQTYGITGPLLSLLRDFLHERLQRVVLNGQTSIWEQILAGVPQGSILGPLLFLIYINDIPQNLLSTTKIFADDVSLFSAVDSQVACADRLNHDLECINEWAHQWKMSFNPDPSKSAVEVYFSKKTAPVLVPPILFNGQVVATHDFQKHIGLLLDKKLSFTNHLDEKISKVNKIIGLIKRLRFLLPRRTLMDIYRSFARPLLDYGDILYDNPGNSTFVDRLESVQYNATLAITGCIRGTSREKLYNELGIESLNDRRHCRRLCFFYKIAKGNSPQYLKNYLPVPNESKYTLRSNSSVRSVKVRTERFQNSFFPFCLSEWNKLDCHIRDLPSVSAFKKAIYAFFRPVPNLIFGVNDNYGLMLLTRLRVGFSHLKEHKFRHNFQDTTDPFCECRTGDIEDTQHYLLHCPNYSPQRLVLFNDLFNLSVHFSPYKCGMLLRLFLYGLPCLSDSKNKSILSIAIKFIVNTERFSGPLFN